MAVIATLANKPGERRDEHDVAKQCHDGQVLGQWQGNAIEWR